MTSPIASTRPRLRVAPAPAQRGIALIIAMIMLVIIGITSVGIMRTTLNNDQVSQNTRAQTQALQYAQAALTYCETHYKNSSPGNPVVFAAATPANWTAFANWTSGSGVSPNAYRLLGSELVSSSTNVVVPPTLPECMIEAGTLPGSNVVITTARGFSLDYSADASGNTTSGSVVWLQSISN